MFTCQTNKSVMNSATKTPAHIPSHCFLLLQRLSTALKQLLVKFPCGSWLPECWCRRLPPGRSHTWEREISRTLSPWMSYYSARQVAAASCCTHTKRKRVHTWSDIGQTQMFPCFWRCFEVITVKTYRELLENNVTKLYYRIKAHNTNI